MLQINKTTTSIYTLLDGKQSLIKVNPTKKYTLLHHLLNKKYILTTGDTILITKINEIININKNFNYFIVTRKPKSYPFKVIKN